MGCLSITRFRTAAATLLLRYDCTVGRGCNVSRNRSACSSLTVGWPREACGNKHSPFQPTPKFLLTRPLPMPAGLIKDVIQVPHCIVGFPSLQNQNEFLLGLEIRGRIRRWNIWISLKYLEYNVCLLPIFQFGSELTKNTTTQKGSPSSRNTESLSQEIFKNLLDTISCHVL